MTPQRSGAPLEPRPLSVVILPTNLKEIVGQCRGRGPGAAVQQEGGESGGGMEIIGEAQDGQERMVNGSARLVGKTGKVQVPAESREDVSAHSFWKRGTTAMFDIQIVNLDAGSYLRMTPEKALTKRRRKIRPYTFRLPWIVEVLLLQWSNLRT